MVLKHLPVLMLNGSIVGSKPRGALKVAFQRKVVGFDDFGLPIVDLVPHRKAARLRRGRHFSADDDREHRLALQEEAQNLRELLEEAEDLLALRSENIRLAIWEDSVPLLSSGRQDLEVVHRCGPKPQLVDNYRRGGQDVGRSSVPSHLYRQVWRDPNRRRRA
jgi:hypothetical protein